MYIGAFPENPGSRLILIARGFKRAHFLRISLLPLLPYLVIQPLSVLLPASIWDWLLNIKDRLRVLDPLRILNRTH